MLNYENNKKNDLLTRHFHGSKTNVVNVYAFIVYGRKAMKVTCVDIKFLDVMLSPKKTKLKAVVNYFQLCFNTYTEGVTQ